MQIKELRSNTRCKMLRRLSLALKRFNVGGGVTQGKKQKYTKCGKYSYGALCDHPLVKSVGAFCSFSREIKVLRNHPTGYISTHPFIYYGSPRLPRWMWGGIAYDGRKGERWYFPGVKPHAEQLKMKKTSIGNDVWIGENVIITNGVHIGNGVIVGAGAVITKDVPDYAVVAGVPARVIKYRYAPEQIEALNKIAWWNWSDETICERYNDFYLPINEFIAKYAL